jgi:hypothetical protein
MKKLMILIFALSMSVVSHGYISGIAIKTDLKTEMQVYVNGKLINNRSENFVRIKGKPGIYHIEVKVLNPYDRTWYLLRKDIRAEKGIEFLYEVEFNRLAKPKMNIVKSYPIYTKYFLKPELYNKNPIS